MEYTKPRLIFKKSLTGQSLIDQLLDKRDTGEIQDDNVEEVLPINK